MSAGEALAGAGIAYTPATNYYKPTTVFVQTGVTVQWDFLKAFVDYAHNTWGPNDFNIQQGLIYDHVYQAGLSAQFLKQFETGFRYIGTRQGDQFLGADLGAFNEYRIYATWHFGLLHNFGRAFEQIGKSLPHGLPEAGMTVSEAEFTPDGSSPIQTVTLHPNASADAGLVELARRHAGNGTGDMVHACGRPGNAGSSVGLGLALMRRASCCRRAPITPSCRPRMRTATTRRRRRLRFLLKVTGHGAGRPCPSRKRLKPPVGAMGAFKSTSEGLRVTLNSLVLFDTGKVGV